MSCPASELMSVIHKMRRTDSLTTILTSTPGLRLSRDVIHSARKSVTRVGLDTRFVPARVSSLSIGVVRPTRQSVKQSALAPRLRRAPASSLSIDLVRPTRQSITRIALRIFVSIAAIYLVIRKALRKSFCWLVERSQFLGTCGKGVTFESPASLAFHSGRGFSFNNTGPSILFALFAVRPCRN